MLDQRVTWTHRLHAIRVWIVSHLMVMTLPVPRWFYLVGVWTMFVGGLYFSAIGEAWWFIFCIMGFAWYAIEWLEWENCR